MKSLRLRIVLGCALIHAVLLVVTGVLVFRFIERESSRDFDQLLKDKATILAKSINRQNPAEVWPNPKEFEREELGFFCQGWDVERQLLWKTDALPEVVPMTRAAADHSWFYKDFVIETIAAGTLGDVRVVTYPVWQVDNGNPLLFAWVQCLKPLAEPRSHLAGIALGLGAGGGLLWLLGALLINTFVGRWLGSMSALALTAKQIGQQARLSQRIPVPEKDPEAAELAGAFNQMLDRVDQLTADQQRFLADASHELRTPLTILRGEIEVALRRDRSAEDYRDVLVSNREEIERLSRLAENLLTLARADSDQALGRRESTDLTELVRGVAHRFDSAAADAKSRIRVEANGPEPVTGDALALERVVFNLVENAVRHSPDDEVVRLAVSSENGDVRLDVVDRGRGVPPEHLPHLFERFYRVDVARNRAAGGAGLGLAIVKSLVEAHGGRVGVSSRIGHGSTFSIWLPRLEKSAPAAG